MHNKLGNHQSKKNLTSQKKRIRQLIYCYICQKTLHNSYMCHIVQKFILQQVWYICNCKETVNMTCICLQDPKILKRPWYLQLRSISQKVGKEILKIIRDHNFVAERTQSESCQPHMFMCSRTGLHLQMQICSDRHDQTSSFLAYPAAQNQKVFQGISIHLHV